MGVDRIVYDEIDFSDKKVLKELMYSRAVFENTVYSSSSSTYDRIEPNNLFYDNIMFLYMDLDRLIYSAGLTDKNIELLELVMSGYTVSYIYNNFKGYNESATIKMFNRALDKIVDKNKRNEVKKA